jgi:hypothetical protein
VGIDADPHQTPGHGALELVAAGHVGCVRAAIAHWHAKTLGAANGNVGTHLPRRNQQGERQQVGGDDERSLLLMHSGNVGAQVGDGATAAGVLVSTAK